MGADFVLAATVVPYRKDDKNKFEILTNSALATKIALKRLKAIPTEDIIDLQYFEIFYEEMADEDGNVDRSLLEKEIAVLIEKFLESYESREGAIITFDVPRLFTGGMTWGDEPSDIYGTVTGLNELQVFRTAITDEEIGEYVSTDWAYLAY